MAEVQQHLQVEQLSVQEQRRDSDKQSDREELETPCALVVEQEAGVGKEQAVEAVPEIEKTPKSSKSAAKKKMEVKKAKKWVTVDKRQVEKPEPPQYQPIAIKKLPGRSEPMKFEPNEITGSAGLTFSVYNGNFPNVVREALALRRFPDGRPIWSEVKADTDNIMAMDLVWKPVGFVRAHGYDMMAKRCAQKPGRPLAYSHFDNIQILSTKPGLIRTLKEYYGKTEAFKKANFTYTRTMALSFVVPGADCLASEELRELKKLFKKFDKKQLADEPLPAKQLEKNFWIVKPENENRGRGIELATSFKELVATLMRKQGDAFIVQKYIERPLLYQGRKFDIRVLAVIDNDRNFYLYKPCYLRTSSDAYTLDSQSKYIHLTNNCFQMHSDNYQRHEADNQIPYCAFLEYLDQLQKDKNQPEYADLDKDHIMQRMKDIMIDCHLAAAGNLDLRKRPGYKLEIVGFDFLLDEDLRVWLLEVNTCPYMGPVLTDQQPHFMLDMLDDTFKLTLDPLYLGRTLSPEEIESETEYEMLCSGDNTINKRSTYGLEVSAATRNESGVVDANDGQVESQQPSYLAEYAASLYPSKMLHQRLKDSQQHYHEKWTKQQRDEQQQLQRMAKVRTAKYSQAAPSQGAHGSSATYAGASAAGLAEIKANKTTYQQRQAAQLHKAHQDKYDNKLPRGESIKLKVLKTNGSISSKPEPPSGSSKRSRSALGGGIPRPTMKTADPITGEQADSRDLAAVNPSAIEAEEKSAEQAAGTQQAHRGQRRREHHPSPAMPPPNLQEQVAQALHANLGPQHYMSNALTKNWQQQDSQRKTFCRLFNLVAAHLGSSDKNAQSQGLSALSSMASSHFVLFLQEKEQLQKLFVLLRPRQEKKEVDTEGDKPQQTDGEAQVHIKLVQCIAHLCHQQVHHGFRSAILESRSIFNKAQKHLMDALANESKEEALPYLKLFLVICAGPEPGLPSKGQTRTKPRRAVYIPGETQEQRRLKRKSIQNGSIVTAHLLQARCPEHAALVTRYLEAMEDHDFVKSFLYFVNSLEAALASSNQEAKANAVSECQLEPQRQESTELARLDSQASQQTDGEARPRIYSCSPEAQQRLRVMHEYFIQEITPTETFKLLKHEVEKQAKTATKTQMHWVNTFPPVLIQELTKSTDSFFDLEYLKTQFASLSGLVEKKQKQQIQNQDQAQPSDEKGQSKTHIQGPAGQALKDIMKNNHALISQSPTRSQHGNQPAIRINQSTSYRGTLINQLKKGKLIPREQMAQRSDAVKEEMGTLGQSNQLNQNQVKFLRDPNLDLGAVKEYSGLSSRAGSTAFKASMPMRMMGPHHVKTKAQMGSETGVKGKKRPGKSYQSQQRASGVIRVSIAAQDIDCSGILSAEVANAPFSSLSVPFSSLSGEQVLQTVNQNANHHHNRSPRAAEQKARPTDLNLLYHNQNQNEEDSAPALASPSLVWQNSQTQKTNLLYAPMLAPLAQKQAQGTTKPESTVDYGQSHPEPIKLTKDESAHLPHLAALPGRPQLPPQIPLHQNTLIRNADSHSSQIYTLKDSSKKTRPPASNFIDQYVQVAHAARAGLIKNKKASNKLNEDYKKALKVLNEMQQNLDAKAQNPSAYCPNLQPYLQNIASNLSSARNDKAFMAQQVQNLGGNNQKSLKSMKTITKSDSQTSVHADSPNQSPYLEKSFNNTDKNNNVLHRNATQEDENQKENVVV